MNELPRVLTNPLIKDKVTFIKTSAETSGEYVLVEVELAPDGGNSLHYHADYEENFEVIEGILGLQYGNSQYQLSVGEKASVPVYLKHRFYNPSKSSTVKFRVTITPASKFEEMIRIAYGLANDGLTNKNGMPNFWYLALMIEKGGSYFPGIPCFIQKAFYDFIAGIARKKGKEKHLLKYYMAGIGREKNEIC